MRILVTGGGLGLGEQHLRLANMADASTITPLPCGLYYSTTDNKVKVYNGSAWENVGGFTEHEHSQYYLQTGDTRGLTVGGRLDIKDD